jgi:hypothetical protein
MSELRRLGPMALPLAWPLLPIDSGASPTGTAPPCIPVAVDDFFAVEAGALLNRAGVD